MFPKRLSFCGDTSSSGVDDGCVKKAKALNMFLNDSSSSDTTNPTAACEQQFRRPTDISTPLQKPKMSFGSNNNDDEEVKISPINLGAAQEVVASRGEGVIKKPRLVFPTAAMPRPDLGHKRRQSAPVSS